MLFQLEQGDNVASIAKRFVSAGRPIPADIPGGPELLPECEYWLTLYTLADYERKYAGGPIPYSAVARISGLMGDALQDAWYVINAADNAVTAKIRDRQEREAKRASKRRGK